MCWEGTVARIRSVWNDAQGVPEDFGLAEDSDAPPSRTAVARPCLPEV